MLKKTADESNSIIKKKKLKLNVGKSKARLSDPTREETIYFVKPNRK